MKSVGAPGGVGEGVEFSNEAQCVKFSNEAQCDFLANWQQKKAAPNRAHRVIKEKRPTHK